MTIAPDVIAAAVAAFRATGIPASVSVAQYGLESAWGTREPPGSNNPFGIKDFHSPNPVIVTTHEFINGHMVLRKQPFARFASLNDAFMAHAELFHHIPVYAPALAALPDVDKFVTLMAAHYATDPAYAQKILSLIASDNLRTLDEA